jgi:hypothetical protein
MRPGVLPVTPETKRQSSEWVGVTSAWPKKTEIPKVLHQDHFDNFVESQDVVHREFVPEGKTANAEFYQEVIDRLLKHNQRVYPAVF